MPAAVAAAISPWEWPMTASGSRPVERHTSARETMTANSAGWTTSMRVRASSSPSTSRSDQPAYCWSRASHSSMRAANTSFVRHRPRAMPVQCAPWPEKTQTTRPPSAAVPVTARADGLPSASAARPSRSSSRSAARTTPRLFSGDLVVAVDQPTSSGRSAVSSRTQSCSCRAWARSACGVRAETITGTGVPGAAPAPCRGGGGASSGSAGPGPGPDSGAVRVSGAATTRWQLVPPMPKELTPASRGPSGHGAAVALTRSFHCSRGMSGFGVS